jgi:hypothetical protein
VDAASVYDEGVYLSERCLEVMGWSGSETEIGGVFGWGWNAIEN